MPARTPSALFLTRTCKIQLMRITEAAERLETTPRMLRYRESLGLLPALRHDRRRPRSRRPAGPARRAGQPGAGQPGAGQLDAGQLDAGQAAGRLDAGQAAGHRQFTEADMAAVALGLSIERRYDISPVALAFGIRVLADPRVRAEVAELGRRIGRIQPPPARALDFEQERAQRLLRLDERTASALRRNPGLPTRGKG
jgi:MerR family copper efflux transcriptional regulator